MANMPWLKLYTEIRTDPKMLALTDTEFRVWIGMLCLASESKDRGVICIAAGIAYPQDALARALFVDAQSLTAALAKYEALRMVDVDDTGIISISHFMERQYDKLSDRPEAVSERVQKHRSAKKMAEMAKASDEVAATCDGVAPSMGNADETPMKRPNNATDIDIDSDSETEVHISCSPAGEPSPEVAPSKAEQDEVTERRHKRQFSSEAQEITNSLKQTLVAKGVTHFERDWHLKSYAATDRMIKSGIPPDEIKRCIVWLFQDAYWYDKVTDMKVVERQLKRFQAAKLPQPPRKQAKVDPNQAQRADQRKRRYEGIDE